MARHTSNGAAAASRPAAVQFNLDAEASILGGILLAPDRLSLLETLEVDDFYDHKHKVVFSAIRNLGHRGAAIDVVTLENEIAKDGKLEAIGGVAFLGELTLRVPTAENVEHYADIVRMHHRNRQAQMLLASALERVKTWPHDPFELVSEVAGELARVEDDHARAEHTKNARWVVSLGEFLGDEEPSDDDRLDWIMRDLVPRAEPFLWAGPQKAGKTWGALDLAIAIALGESWLGRFEHCGDGPQRVLCIFLEDNKRRLQKRIWELARARHKPALDRVLCEHFAISRTPLRLPDAQDQRRLIAELKKWKPAVVLLDNLTRVMVGDPNSTREAAAFTRAWIEIGEEVGASVGFLHHTKKPVGDQREVDPFDQVRGSSDFGAAARNIIVSRPLPHETDKIAEVRMRGNLDLRCESFVLGFSREQGPLGGYQAKLVDRGEVKDVKDSVKRQRSDDKEQAKIRSAEELYQKRKNLALELAHKDSGFVTAKRLATALGLSSDRAVAGVFDRMLTDKLLERAGKLGFAIPGATPQRTL
jgi:hypothetical protein